MGWETAMDLLFAPRRAFAGPSTGGNAAHAGGVEFDKGEADEERRAAREEGSQESGEGMTDDSFDSNGEKHIGAIGANGWSWWEFSMFVGPAWLVSIAYLDPGNLETDLQSGAQYGYALGWVLLWSSILGIIVQILSLRLGIVSKRNLAEMCRDEYHPRLSLLLWVMSELMIVASDVPEVIGTAFALQILSGGAITLVGGVLIASCSTMIFLFLNYFGKSPLELFVGFLVAVISACFVLQCLDSRPDAGLSVSGIIRPQVPKGSEGIAMGLLGAVVMPHNLFLQSALVQSRAVRRERRSIEYACMYTSVETCVALLTSFLVNLSVMLVAASSFAPHWCEAKGMVCHGGSDPCDGESPGAACMEVGLQTASVLLSRILGSKASVLWGVALLASGQSSTITGTYAGQFVMEGFVRLSCPLWVRNLLSRSLAVLPSLAVVLLAGADGANDLIVFSSVVLAVHLPFALIPLLKFTDSPKKMGRLRNSRHFSNFSWALAGVVFLADLALVWQTVIDPMLGDASKTPQLLLVGVCCFGYFGLAGYLMWLPVKHHAELPTELKEGGDEQSGEALDAPFLVG